ncbi:hypothetical protein KJY73_16180 [Bowmanella sp. Y26]|uniref:hypothetical protein n=1 Tax=Bowmanella yangjiangensis TaxID=2811230 RepID=UPI001BDD1957|nr:hypothetical protein [Bowmanella yangjiangensis]MBT1065131.1 hypothetical protein [Bowmanella yangjiangensis]
MHVSQIRQPSPIFAAQQSGSTAHSGQTTSSASADQVSISAAGKELQQSWQSLADGYDVRNISQNELHALSDALYQGGFIGRGEHLVLGAPRSMHAAPDTKYDLLGEMQQSFGRFAQGMTTEEKHNYQGAIDILRDLASSRRS